MSRSGVIPKSQDNLVGRGLLLEEGVAITFVVFPNSFSPAGEFRQKCSDLLRVVHSPPLSVTDHNDIEACWGHSDVIICLQILMSLSASPLYT